MIMAKIGVRIPVGASDSRRPLTEDVERFLSLIRFESKGILGELPEFTLDI